MDARLKGKRILVTGGLGYIGKHVVRAFIEAGAEYVEIWDIKKAWNKDSSNVDWVKGNVGYNPVDIYEHTEMINHYAKDNHFHVVINLAALADVPSCEANPERAEDVNVFGMQHVMFAANVWNALFIQADSAMSPFGSSASIYAYTKLDAKAIVLSNREKGFPSICLTLYNVAGAHPNLDIGEDHDPETHLIPNVINAILENKPFEMDKNPNVKRDFIHVCDVADAFVRAALRYVDGCLKMKDYEVGRGIEMPIQNVVAQALELDMTCDTVIKMVDTGRWEPYDHGITRFAANPDNTLPDWTPKYGLRDMIYHQYCFAERRLPK